MSTNSTCPYCGTGCGVIIETAADHSMTVRGDTTHPANYGRSCSKGSALAEALTDHNRLLYPQIDGQRTSWNQTIDHVARSLKDIIEKFGHESVAFHVSGQLLTEDYYVVNKLTKGWFGTANIDSNSRHCNRRHASPYLILTMPPACEKELCSNPVSWSCCCSPAASRCSYRVPGPQSN